jgi:hypothetical protein
MITLNPNITKLVAAVSVASMGFAPFAASAQSRYQHREQTKNQWKNLGIAGGAVGLLGLLSGNKTLAIAGIAGGAYSAWRYEQDRKSQNKMARGRAEIFSKPYIMYHGHRYNRRTYTKNGHKYYEFVRAN